MIPQFRQASIFRLSPGGLAAAHPIHHRFGKKVVIADKVIAWSDRCSMP